MPEQGRKRIRTISGQDIGGLTGYQDVQDVLAYNRGRAIAVTEGLGSSASLLIPVFITQTAYDALAVKDPSTVYYTDTGQVYGPQSLATAKRSFNGVTLLGDSTTVQINLGLGYSNYNHFNVGNALAGNRALPLYQGGVSGDRTDQIRARLTAALSVGAGTLYLSAGINTIGKAPFTHLVTGAAITDANSGVTALADMVFMMDAALALGMRVICALCHGSSAYTQAQVGQLAVLNAGLRRYAEKRADVWLFDSPQILKNHLTSTTSALAYKASYMRTGETGGFFTHEGTLGAYFAGKAFASILKEVMRPIPRFDVGNDNQYTAGLSRSQLAPNPAFTGTGGTFGTGGSGTVPDTWAVNRLSGDTTTTFVCSIEARADGNGNDLRIDYTGTVAGGGVRVQYSIAYNSPAWVAGDLVQLFTSIDVASGATGLSHVSNLLTTFDGTTPVQSYGLQGDLTGAGSLPSTEGYSLEIATSILTVPDHSVNGSYLLIQPLDLKLSGAGTGTVRLHMPYCEVKSTLV